MFNVENGTLEVAEYGRVFTSKKVHHSQDQQHDA